MTEPDGGIRVAALDDISEGEGLAISSEITGTEDDIAILRDLDGSCWALNDTCTHAQASLADGWVEDGYVECPVHSSRFCLRDGHVDGPPATVDTVPHRVEVREGEIYLFPNQRP
ncbi:MAG: non-heme iron oxygenase ferredoxin subunit [Nocardioides sp.]|uniref:non-heme iron oxygenase ferredoxin subunit n=1 Tax=Nocardioides sp. TaxID=35761 RepID=UPI0039E62167